MFITNPNFPTPNQLLRAINQEFEVPQSAKSYLIFKYFLMTQALTRQKTLVLIIDEASDHQFGALSTHTYSCAT